MSFLLPAGRRGGRAPARATAAVSASTAALLAFGFCAAPAALAAPVTVNPVSGNHGFLVMTEAEAMLGNGNSEGPVAVGGDLEFMNSSVATATAGTFTAPGDDRPTALVVGGTIGAGMSVGDLRVRNDGYVKIGDLGDTSVDNDGESTVITLPGEESARVTLTTRQPEESVESAPVDFASAFAEYRTRSAALASCEPTVTPVDTDTGEPFGDFPMAERTARIGLEQGKQNVWNVSADDLSSLMGIEFGDVKPSADTPLVVNVLLPETGREEGSFLLVPPMTGIGAAEAPYVLYNISGAPNLFIGSIGPLPGTLFAPEATVIALLGGGLQGNVITKRFGSLSPEELMEIEAPAEEFEALEEEALEEAEEEVETPRFDNTLYNVPFATEVELCGTEAPDTGSGDDGDDGDDGSDQDGNENGGGGTTPPPDDGEQDSDPSPTPVVNDPDSGDEADGGLPVTGAGLVGLVAAAVAAVIGGAVALVLARRRRNA